MMSGSRCVKRYQKIFPGFLIKSARFLLKIKKNLSVVEIYRCKNLAEDVLMTGAEQSGLICVSHHHQLWFTFQDWLKVYGNITCWVISSRPTDCRDLEDDCIAFCYWYTLGSSLLFSAPK